MYLPELSLDAHDDIAVRDTVPRLGRATAGPPPGGLLGHDGVMQKRGFQ